MSNIKLFIRNLIKAILQFCILPLVYIFYKNRKIQENLVIFADSKNDGIPYSMLAMYKTVKNTSKYEIKVLCINYSKLSIFKKAKAIIEFMKLYANAKYVFICDYFLPVSSCNKRKETKVIQLWHAAGVLKKFGYDAENDLKGKNCFNKATKNMDYVFVSSEFCVKFFCSAFNLKEDNVLPLGTSRTDILFNKDYIERCVVNFYEKYPDFKNKKIILWAPSFRGNVEGLFLNGYEEIKKLQKELPEEYKVIIKVHPHLKNKYDIDNCDIATNEIYPVVDLLITDYSSILFDFILLKKKIVLFVPDYEQYQSSRGMYIDEKKEFDFPTVIKNENLSFLVIQQLENSKYHKNYKEYKNKFLISCTGKVSKKILCFLEKSSN